MSLSVNDVKEYLQLWMGWTAAGTAFIITANKGSGKSEFKVYEGIKNMPIKICEKIWSIWRNEKYVKEFEVYDEMKNMRKGSCSLLFF